MTKANETSLLEELFDDDPFIMKYPCFKRYLKDWDESGGVEALLAPRDFIFELYADKVPVNEGLDIWFTYNETTN